MECRMHRTIEFVRLQLQLFVKGSRCVVPTVVLAVFLYAMYSSKPVGIVSSFTISGYLSFFLMLWVGLRVSSTEDAVAEQIYLLRLEGSFWYYLGKVGFYCTVGVLLTLVCLAYPLLQNLVNAGGMFTRPLTVADIGNALFLLLGCSIVGGSMGSFFHPRVLPDRKLAIALTIFVGLLVIVRGQIVKEVSFLEIPYLLLPQVDQVMILYSGAEKFELSKTAGIFIQLIGYSGVYYMLQGLLCQKRKF